MKVIGRSPHSEPRLWLSETDSHAAIDHAAVKRRPRVDGPASVDATRRPQQWIPVRLLHIRQVLAVDEDQRTADAATREHAKETVRCALRSVRVGLQTLRARVVPLDAETPHIAEFPRAVDPDGMTRGQWHFHASFVSGLSRTDERVAGNNRQILSLPDRDR